MNQRVLEIIRFVVGGGSTTVFSYAVYLALLQLSLAYMIAYPISFAAGVIWSYFVNSWFVFKRRPTIRGLIAFPIVYLVQLVLGTAVVYVAVSRIGLPAWAGPLVAIAATLPLTYVFSRLIITRTSTSSSAASDSDRRDSGSPTS